MGTKYPGKTIVNYNDDPPPNDGSQISSNEVDWDKHIDEIGDPIKTLAEAINTALVAAADTDSLPKTGAYTTVADDHGRVVECTNDAPIDIGEASSMGGGYFVIVKCVSGTSTVDPTGSDAIDGSASTRTLIAGEWEAYAVNATEDGYLLVGGNNPIITTRGDVIIGNASGAPERLAVGTDGQVLISDGTDVSWGGGGTWAYHATLSGGEGTTTLGENTSIPSGITGIKFVFNEVMLDGSGNIYIHLGDASAYSSTGDVTYIELTNASAVGGANITNGTYIVTSPSDATEYATGIVEFLKVNGAQKWIGSGNAAADSNEMRITAGYITLSTEITRAKVIVTADVFDSVDAGSVDIYLLR